VIMDGRCAQAWGLMREGIYGLGGAAFEGSPGAWSKFKLTESQQTAVEVEYPRQARRRNF